MRFGVLGPLAVWTQDGRPVRIPEVKVRMLLAELVLAAGRVVPADRLIEDLWGANLPANPAGALQTRVSQLRRALDDAEPGARKLVVSRAPGYLLDVPPDAVDTGRFEALLDRARTAGTDRDRAALLGEALALWRGPALIDYADEEFARPEIARLAELRLAAVEDQAEARLALGEHGLLAGELGDLVVRHPLRERLRALHMTALYRAGRQSEALQSYHDLRTRLAEELGVDPGPELAPLHQAMLVQDPSLAAAPAPPGPPPSNLPAPLGDLIGRSREIDEVASLLAADRLVTLTGPGGVGKTRLALAAARRAAEAFPDGAWLVELGSLAASASRNEVAELVAAALRIRDETTTALVDLLPETLAAKQLLLVLDNCEHVVAPVAELASALLRAAPGLRILATGQRPLAIAGERLVHVPPLAGPDAVRLFIERATAAGTPALDADDMPVVRTICQKLDGIPLALELAATRVRLLGVRELAARLDDRFRLLAAGYADAPARQRTLRAMIDWSWELLGKHEQTLLSRLAVFADGCSLEAAEAVCADEGMDVLSLLAGLVDRSLVAVAPPHQCDGPRYRLLESVAAYSQEKLYETGETAEIEQRHLRHYTELAAVADANLRGPAQGDWLCRLDAEAANMRAALDHASRHGGVLRLVNSLAWYWVLRGRLGEGRRSLTAALDAGGPAEEAATARIWLTAFTLRMGDMPDPADLLPPSLNLADRYVAEAPPHRQVAPEGRGGDLELVAARARAEVFLAFSMLGIGDPAVGEELAERALTAFRGLGDQWGMAAAFSVRAQQALIRGDIAVLKDYGERSMALFTALGDRWGRLHSTFSLGVHAEIAGDYAESARWHRDGLRTARDLGLSTEVSDKLAMLGRIALLTGDHEQADGFHRQALELAAEHGYTIGEEFAEIGLALGARRQGRLDDAERHLRRWLDWNRRLGSDIALSLILAELGFISELRGDPETARARHLESLAAARVTGDRRAVALALEGLAGARLAAGEPAEAARLLGMATALREAVGAPLPPAERGDVERIAGGARAALGPAGFAAEFDAGASAPDGHVDGWPEA